MRIRVYETGKLDLGTVAEMLCQTDRQTNFDPASRWIDYTTETITTDHFEEIGYKKKYKDIFVRWIGVEQVVMWLTNNQIVYEIMSYELLSNEQEALEQAYPDSDSNPEEIYLN